jgi:hypothetical protein
VGIPGSTGTLMSSQSNGVLLAALGATTPRSPMIVVPGVKRPEARGPGGPETMDILRDCAMMAP